jgi:hypothetical protein
MTVTNSVIPDTGDSQEAAAIAGVVEALSWRHRLGSNPEVKRPGQRVVIYQDFLTKLGLVLATCNLAIDTQEKLWRACQAILNLLHT